MVTAYIGLGSNLDNPLAQVRQAIRILTNLEYCQIQAVSSLYQSKPMGPQDQPDYVNAVMAIRTDLSALQLLDALQAVEQQQGRVRGKEQWGPRTLDLDILLFDDLIIDEPRLKIPHPGLHQRSFVLYPLHEIAPELHVPGRGTLTNLLERVENDLEVIGDES